MKLRVARHTKNTKAIIDFYESIIGLSLTGEFKDHDGYSGIFFSAPNQNWELEFTESSIAPTHTFDDDDLLVFYQNEQEIELLKSTLKKRKIKLLTASNSYWNKNGIHFKDPDGYGIIVTKILSTSNRD